MQGTGASGPIPALMDSQAGTVGHAGETGRAAPVIRIGGRELDLRQILARVSKTFMCIGPICLRSGVGFGAGIGCGAGIGRGAAIFRVETSASNSSGGGFTVPYHLMNQIPGGYQMISLLKTVMRKFPGSKTGLGCGIGVGYGFGFGLQYGAGGGGGGMMGSGGGMGGMGMGGMMGGTGGGGMMGGSLMGGRGSMDGGMMGGRAGGSGQSGVGAVGSGARLSDRSAVSSTITEERVQKLEKKVAELEDKLGMQLRLKELEQRLTEMETSRKRR